MESDEDDYEVDDLEGLQKELDQLRQALGDTYVQLDDTEQTGLEALEAAEAIAAAPQSAARPPSPAARPPVPASRPTPAVARQLRNEAPKPQHAAPATAAGRRRQPAVPKAAVSSPKVGAQPAAAPNPPAKARAQRQAPAAAAQPAAPPAKRARGQQAKQARPASPPPAQEDEWAAADEEWALALAPSKVETIQTALKANRQLQEGLRRLLRSVATAQHKNARVLHQVRDLQARKRAAEAVPAMAVERGTAAASARVAAPPGTSWYWKTGEEAVPPYPDARQLPPALRHLPLSYARKAWSQEERARLQEGVVQLVQEEQLNESFTELQQRLDSGGQVGAADYEACKQLAGQLTLESPVVDQKAARFSDEDWTTIIVRMQLQRSVEEVLLQWRNLLAPSVNSGPFTADEDEQLLQLVERHGEQGQWAHIAAKLGTKRTPLACLQRRQQLAAQAVRGDPHNFAPQDLARLEAAVKKHGLAWKRVAEEFGGIWEGEQLMHIWRRHVQRGPVGRRGKWSEEEDAALLSAMAVHRDKWSRVARLVPGRSDVQCRERYMNVLSPEIQQFTPWTAEEDAQLLELIPTLTRPNGRVRWSKVAAQLPGRSDKQCTSRWARLQAGDDGRLEPRAKPARSKRQRGGGSRARVARKPAAAARAGSKAGGKRKRAAALAGCGSDSELTDTEEKEAAAPAESEGSAEAGSGDVSEEEQQQEVEESEAEGQAARPRRRQQQRRSSAKGAAAGTTRPRRTAKRRQAASSEEEEGEEMEEPEVLPAAPEPTASEMPLPAAAAMGWVVHVWWLAEADAGEAPGAGALHRGRLASYHPDSRQHTVVYRDGSRYLTALHEETVVWPGGAVTGPGASWPAAAAAAQQQQPAAAVAAAQEA